MSKRRKKLQKKAKELKRFKPDEVSLVTAGANKKTAFIIKNENGESDMPEKDLIEKLGDFKFADEEKTVKSIESFAKAEGLDETQKEALKTALAIIESTSAGASGFSMTTDQGYASVSVYKSEDEADEPGEGEEAEGSTDSEEAVEETNEEVEKSAEKIEELEGKIEKLSELIEDTEAVDRIVKGEEVHVAEIPAHIKKQLNDQEKELAIIRKERDEKAVKLAKSEEEKVEKSFIGKVEKDMNFVAKSEELGLVLLKASRNLDEADYEVLETVLKEANCKIEKSKMFEEVGESSTIEDEAEGEELVDSLAKEEVAKSETSGNKISIHKARDIVRTRLAKEAKSKQ